MAAIMEEVKKNRIDRYRAQSRSPSPRKGDKQGCFHCGAMGHFKRECPRLGSPTGEKRVSFQENKEALMMGGYKPPVSGGLFNLFQMSQQEDVLSLEDSGCFDTAEAGSSADEMEDCLSAVSERVAVAEVTGPPSSKVPAGAEAPGSEGMIDSPG